MESLGSFYSEKEVSPERIVKVILADLGLCVQVLRAANSAYYNPLGFPMYTVSRAAVLLGFDNLKQMAQLASLLNEDYLQNEDFLREYALCLITAHLAEQASEKRGTPPEEAYLGGLFRRFARLMLIMKAPKIYEQILSLTPSRRKELLLLLGHRLARHWNLPSPILDGLEGQEHETQKKEISFYPSCERLALSLLEEGVFLGWQRLFENPKKILKALEELKKKLPYLPPRLREALLDWTNIDEKAFLSEAPPEDQFFYLSRETLRLVQKINKVLNEELEAEGEIFFLDENGLESLEGRELSPETEKFLRQILLGKKIYFDESHHLCYLPVFISEQPALLVKLKKKEPFSSEEVYGLNLVQKIIQGLLRRF